MEWKLLVLLLLLILSAFFSGSEIAFASLSPAKVRKLLEKKNGGSKSLAWFKENPQRFISTILIGNNVVNISLSAIATVLTIELFGNKWVGAATGVVTFVVLVFGEIMPKTLASAYAEPFSLAVARPMRLLANVLWPLVAFFEALSTRMLAAFGAKKEPTVTEDELKVMARMAAEEGVIEHTEREMLESLFQFNDITASDVMTPRVDVFALEANKKIGDVVQKILNSPFSRVPIYTKSIDRITGVLYVRDILQYLVDKKDPDAPLRFIARPLFFVPHSMTLNELFREFQVRKIHIAVVLDEHGGTEGLVTLEDLLEEIVGEIHEEAPPRA